MLNVKEKEYNCLKDIVVKNQGIEQKENNHKKFMLPLNKLKTLNSEKKEQKLDSKRLSLKLDSKREKQLYSSRRKKLLNFNSYSSF